MAVEIDVQGSTLEIYARSGGSPTVIVQVTDLKKAAKARTVDVSNISDPWERLSPTLLSMGVATFTIFWDMTDATHNNSTGLRSFFTNKTLVTCKLNFNDGAGSYDQWPAYVTGFEDSEKTADKVRASITVSPYGTPDHLA